MTGRVERLPVPADFGPIPSRADRARWAEADRAARPARLARLRARMAAAGVDAYLGVRPEHSRYLTGLVLGDGEEKVAGYSGWFVVGPTDLIVFADSRYTLQVGREAPDARVEPVYGDLTERWPEIAAVLGARRVAVESSHLSHAAWTDLAESAPGIELVAAVDPGPAGQPGPGWIEADRATKEPAELERVGAACTVADRALAALLPEIRPGVTEAQLAWRLEVLIRTGGADGLAFDVACLAGAEAALPHGSPGDRPVQAGAVLLFDFGAQVAGYRSDMTRTLFVGEPNRRDLEIYELVHEAQSAAIDGLAAAVAAGGPLPSGPEADALARDVIVAAGHGDHFGHGTGHGIGLATHELPSLGRRAARTTLPSPTVFSVEPGVYLDGRMGVRIEDLVAIDATARKLEILTRFPRQVVVVDG
ncbi:MAG: M24 family metallopeptidase [Candidatus Limnocylindrales bacterium]